MTEAPVQVLHPPKADKPYHRFVIPKSAVEKSILWRGKDSDLIFGLREPTGAEAMAMASDGGSVIQNVPKFVVQIGDQLVTDYTRAQVWYETILTAKAKSLVNAAFVRLIVPTDEEGESLLGSQTPVG